MKKVTVAVVEDLIEIRESLKDRIEFTEELTCVGTYGSAEDALRYLPKKQPQIVIMDIGLPYMSGIECMLRIKLKHPEIKFLMFTIFDHDEHVFEALKAGANGYILKENGSTGVIIAIQELLDGGAPMSSAIAKKVLESFHLLGASKKKLTPRQVEVLQLLAEGLQYKEIADRLVPAITVGGLKQHINRIYKVLEVNNRTEAINKWLGRNQ